MKKTILLFALIAFAVAGYCQKQSGIKYAQTKTINIYPAQTTATDTASFKILTDDEDSKQLIVLVWVGGTNPRSFDMVVWHGADYIYQNDRTKNQVREAVKAKLLAR